jgi:GT2 family glycosyltransferase
MTTFDIIIVNYNSTDHLLRCLESIEHTLGAVRAKIIVVDNASTENVERIIAAFPGVQLIKNTTNVGFARAVNQGISRGSSTYIMLLNPDTIISPDFFNKGLEFMDQHPGVAIMGPRIMDPDGSIQGSARSFPTALTALFGRTSFLTRLFPNNPISRRNILTTDSDGRTVMPVDWVSGACMVVRRKAIASSGLMDECFFMYSEDTDCCKRMWEEGWTVVYYPEVSLTHLVGTSSRKSFVRSTIEFHRSAFIFYRKHSSRAVFCLMLPVLIGGLGLRCLIVLLKGPK